MNSVPVHQVGSPDAEKVVGVNVRPDPLENASKRFVPDSRYEIFFRIGFASIFLVNSVAAWMRPDDFYPLLSSFPAAQAVGRIDLLVLAASFNDLILGGLILSGIAKKYVFAWAGLWLTMVSTIKLVSLF